MPPPQSAAPLSAPPQPPAPKSRTPRPVGPSPAFTSALLLLAVLVALAPSTRFAGGAPAVAAPPPEERDAGGATGTIEIPLREGRYEVAALLRAACEGIEVEPPAALDRIDWTLDVQSLLGQAQLEALERLTRGAVTVTVDEDRLTVAFDRSRVAEEARGASEALGAWIEGLADRFAKAPVARVTAPRTLGLSVVTDDDPHAPLETLVAAAGDGDTPPRVVVLIHGLDDPGWMWRDVIPALRGAGFTVLRMEYANDGPISDGADLFALELERLRRLGVTRVDVVAHSMGGLVTRDVLTRPAYYAGDASGGGGAHGGHPGGLEGEETDEGGGARFPAIERLIMCGTPNHGSGMARLRAFTEIKEQVSRAFSGDGPVGGGFSDGSGEAGVDLLPDSDFLRRLNGREAPVGVRMTIIAGRMSPFSQDDVAALGRGVHEAAASANAPRWLQAWLEHADDETTGFLSGAVRGLGDGCVSLDSARLEGVDDFVVVEANHVSMIVNFPSSDSRTPPAIPIILARLGIGVSVPGSSTP